MLRIPLACLLALVLLAQVSRGQLDADFSATPTSGAHPLTVSFMDTTTGGTAISWVWHFGDGASSFGMKNPTHEYALPGTYTVSLSVLSAGLSQDQEVKEGFITVDPAPLVVGFSATPTQGAPPLLVAFTDTSTGATTTGWSWDFGDGSSSTAQNPTHQYNLPGSYTVSLTAFVGQQSDTLVQADLITVDPVPLVVGFSATPTQGTNPLTVAFSDTSTGATTTAWSWDFGDGGSSTAQNPTHQYNLPGSYTVSLTAFVGQQSDTLVQADLITVDPAPLVVGFSATPTQGTNPLTVAFSDTSTGATTTAWSWDFGDGFTSTDQNPTHLYTGPGSYTVSLTAFVGQQSDTLVQAGLITVEPAPLVVAFSATPTQGPSPLVVAFTDESTTSSAGASFMSWSWDFGDGATSEERSPTHVYQVDEATSFTVSLTVFVGQQSDTLVKPALIAVEAPGPVQTLVIFENGEVHPDFIFSVNVCCGPGAFSEPGTQYTGSHFSEITITRADGGAFNAVSFDVLGSSFLQWQFAVSSSAGGWLELWDGMGTALMDGPEWDALTSLTMHGYESPGNPAVLHTDNYVVEVPAECFLVMGNGLGGDAFTPGGFAFGTGLSQIQASYPVLMDDYPTFTLPKLGAGGQGTTSSGPGSSTSGSFGYPDWIGPDGVFTAQVMMWSPSQVPGNPEQYSSVLTGWISPDGSVHVRSHGSGDIDLTLETGVNANGETTFSFPFAIDM
jgi:PKD repeat protein